MRTTLLLLSSCVAALTATSFANDVPRAAKSAIIVSSHIRAHEDAIGAGVIVAIRPHGLRVLTAKHVADRGDVTVWLERRPYAAEIVRTFAHRDLAVVDAIVPATVVSQVVAADPGGTAATGDTIEIWGENDAGPQRKTGTIVAQAWSPPDDPLAPPVVSIACASCSRGDSGGGIFDIRGRLLGILTARYRRADGTTVATVGERIEAALYGTPEVVTDMTGDVADPNPH